MRPRIRKPSLEPLDIKSYRPISNLSFISKVVERLAVNRFSDHAFQHNLLPERQSAYRRYHSTETAITIVYNDIVPSTDAGFVSAWVLLDLSAAFATVDHNMLIDVLWKRFGVQQYELNWFQSYHSGRSQTFVVSDNKFGPVALTCSVPQGSVIGCKKFVAYTEDIVETIDRFAVNHHLYAEDSQLLIHMHLEEVAEHRHRLELCVEQLRD